MRLIYLLTAGILLNSYDAAEEGNESDSDTSRKILGSSVVTSVSVVLDSGNGKKTVYTDAIGTPQSKPSNPSDLASPINLLNPDRYEFYTFDDNGDLVKRLMSLDEIKSIIATGDSDALDFDSFTSQGFLPEKRVSDVVSNVQNVLKEELEILKDPITKPIFDTPDVSDSWSMILPAVFGNSGHDIKPEKPPAHVTADTIMLEPNVIITSTTPAPQKVDIILSSSSTIKNRPLTSSTHKPSSYSTSSPFVTKPVYYSSSQSLSTTQKLSSTTEPTMNVEIFANSMTTQKDPSKESTNDSFAVEEKQSEKEEPIPTRAPAVHVAKPPLVRNVTKNEDKTSTLASLAASTPLEYLTEIYLPFSAASSETSGPTTMKTTKISFKPIIEERFPDLFSTTSKMTSTSSKPSSVNLTTRFSTTQGSSTPSTSPTGSTYKTSTFSNKNVSSTISSTINTPTNKGTVVSASTSKLTIKPQLDLSSTVSNDYSTSSNKISSSSDQFSTHLSSTVPVTVLKTTEPDLLSEGSLSSVSTLNLGHATSTSMKPSSWTPSIKDSELFNIFKQTIAKGTTAGYIYDSKPVTVTNTKDSTTERTIKEPATTTENKNQSNDYNHLDDNDLSTLPTEYLGQNIIGSTNENNNGLTTKFPPLLHSLSDNQKLSASELLDQLLFTTNIYEINTELASPKLNATNTDVRFDNKETNQQSNPVDQEFDQQITTTDHDIISYPPTTDVTLIQSIEQLLSQAVGDIEIALNQTVITSKLQEGLQGNKNMTDFIRESATMASEITVEHKTDEPIQASINTSEESYVDTVSTIANSNDLSSSVDALLSQVYENTATNNKIRFTETPDIGITYRRADDSNETPALYKSSTQKYDPNSETSTEIKKETVSVENLVPKDTEAQQETTTYYYVIKKKINSSNKGEPSNLLNITVLDVEPQKKPAKADLSLEQEIIAEEMKNSSLVPNNTFTSESISNELLKLSETNLNELGLTNVNSSNINQTENSTENLGYFTTPYLNEYDTTRLSEQTQTTEDNLSTVSDIETSTNSLLDMETTEFTTTKTVQKEEVATLPSTTTKKNRNSPKPSIVITVNENNTVVTENGKLVANKTNSSPLPFNPSVKNEPLIKQTNTSTIEPIKFIEKNSTQDQTWTLVSTVAPHLSSQNVPPPTISYQDVVNPPVHVDLVPKPMQGFGLEESTANLDTDVFQFAQLCNELAFGFWKTVTAGLSSARSIFVSPFAAISMLAMVFLGAKGATSEEMNEILKLDDMVSFNPHLIFKNVSESITDEPYSGVATTAMIRELFSDRSKGKLLDFYKNRVKAFYDGYVEEVGYRRLEMSYEEDQIF